MAEKKQIVENPAFTAQKPKYKRDSDLCEGGDAIEKDKSYLPKHAYESPQQYDVRLSLATYKNHAAPIVTVFTSSVWRNPPERELPSALDPLKANVDKLGTSANSFFRRSGEDAAKVGLTFVHVEQDFVPKEENRNLSDSQRAGMRPYFIKIPALKVPDWGYDSDGLVYLVVDESSTKKTDAFREAETTTQYRIWDRKGWTLWKKGDDGNLEFEKNGTHKCGEVPIRPHYFRKKAEMIGESAIADVASLMTRAYQMENALDKALFDTAFPFMEFIGFATDDIDGLVKSSSTFVATENTDARVGYVEPTGVAFEALDTKVKSDEQSIREIALRMYKTDSKVGESYDAKKLDRQQLDSQLSIFSQGSEDLEVWCWNMALKWLGEESKSGEIKIEYNQDFDIEQASSDLIKSLAELVTLRILSKQTTLEILEEQDTMPTGWTAVDEDARLKAESGRYGDDF